MSSGNNWDEDGDVFLFHCFFVVFFFFWLVFGLLFLFSALAHASIGVCLSLLEYKKRAWRLLSELHLC